MLGMYNTDVVVCGQKLKTTESHRSKLTKYFDFIKSPKNIRVKKLYTKKIVLNRNLVMIKKNTLKTLIKK